MSLKFFSVIVILSLVAATGFSRPAPDSAGIIPLEKGLAYGGIPYGSVSGQLSLYFGPYEPLVLTSTKDYEDNNIQLL